jgi:hypothetical protein
MYSQNKNISEALQQLDELPGGIRMDSAATWSKIEDRLQPKKTHKLALLRYAAVFLLVVSGIVIYMLSGKSLNERLTGIATSNEVDIQKTVPIATKTEEPVIAKKIVIFKSTRRKQQPVIITQGAPLPEKNPTVVTTSPVINIPVIETGIAAIPVNQNTIVNTAPLVTNTTVKKPRLRIVHLNDLYKPDPAEIAKAETKKHQAAEEVGETEPTNAPPPKPFWKSKAATRIAISLTDNQ